MLTQNFQIGFCFNSLKNNAGLVFAGSLAVDRVGDVQIGFAIVIMSLTHGCIRKKSDGILHFQLFLKLHLLGTDCVDYSYFQQKTRFPVL